MAGSTLAVVALFSPVRRKVLLTVDRRFHRSHYNAELAVEEFSGRLRDQTDPALLSDYWLEIVATTLQPATSGVWLRRR